METINIILFVFIVVMTLLGSLGGLFFKLASSANIMGARRKIIYLGIGFGIYGISAFMNIYVLKFLPYTIVYPLTSITYIWTFIFSGLLLGEKITIKKIVGVVFIVGGAFVLGI